jgi:hypothetical protein
MSTKEFNFNFGDSIGRMFRADVTQNISTAESLQR